LEGVEALAEGTNTPASQEPPGISPAARRHRGAR
jgi:hypothetical protein